MLCREEKNVQGKGYNIWRKKVFDLRRRRRTQREKGEMNNVNIAHYPLYKVEKQETELCD